MPKKTELSYLHCEINGAVFEAEGPPEEISKKFTEWLATAFEPIKTVRNALEKSQRGTK